ncbi:hypothetical protein [Mucilaginibacter sp.]|uniref:hypothetical protein n=1 Tax=Mucilaginibacter sp. TaxID=1882438 RepID=UPI003D0F838F
MTGNLAQVIALVSFGNDFLQTSTLPSDFYPDNSTFQFCNSVKFVALKKSILNLKIKEKTIADNPYLWFELLKNENCKKLALYFQNSEQSKSFDHELAGLVGGGGNWFIEAIYHNHSDFWVNNWEVSNNKAIEKKIWSVKYGATLLNHKTINNTYQLHIVWEELKMALNEIADFAFKNTTTNWGETFENAAKNLSSQTPENNFYHKDFIIAKNYTLLARQIIYSAGLAWVFGGMGTWNDMCFNNDEINNLYNKLSEKLYNCINKSIIAVCNS